MAKTSINDLESRIKDLETIIRDRIPGGGVVDPAPWVGGWIPRWPLPHPTPFPFPFPQPGDPSPIDLSRLTRTQLEMSREMIKTERFRLDSMEKLISDQIKALK